MLKVAVVTAHFPNAGSPTDGRSAYQTLRVLSRKTNLQVFFPTAAIPSFVRSLSRSHGKSNKTFLPPPDVKASYLKYPAVPVVSRSINGWVAARALLPHVRRFAPDLILSHFLYPDAYAGVEIGKLLSVPVLAWGVGSDVHSIGDRITAMHTRSVLRRADFVGVVSSDLRERVLAMGARPDTTRTVVNGCDVSVFHVRDKVAAKKKLHIDPTVQAVVYIGRMDVKKGLRELVEAAAAIRPERPNLHVYLVGDGPDRQVIESAIAAHNAGGFIHSLPGCPFSEVATWMAASDLVTLPSYMEGCPNSVLEGLACGRPVVATNVGGIPEIMSDRCGRLVPPRDAAALAKALSEVLDETWDAKEISAQRSRSWENVADEFLEIFQFVLSNRRTAAHGR